MFKPLHSKTNQELMKSTSVTYDKYKWCHAPPVKGVRPSIIIWKVKYSLHFVVSKELPENPLCNQVATMTNMGGATLLIIIWKWSIHYASLSNMFILLHSNTDYSKSTSVIKVYSHYENRTISIMQRKPSCATTTSTLFTVSKDECNTKEDTG